MQIFRIPYIPYRSLLLSTTILNDSLKLMGHSVFQPFCKCTNSMFGERVKLYVRLKMKYGDYVTSEYALW